MTVWQPFPILLASATALFLLIALFNRRAAGFSLVLLAAALHFGAIQLYHSESARLAGQPDLLYVWIVPMLMLVLSVVASISAIIWNVAEAILARRRRAGSNARP